MCSKDGQEFNGSIFHKVNSDLSAGIQLAWTSGSNATKFGIGAQYALDKNSTVRAKISNDSLIGKTTTLFVLRLNLKLISLP